MYTGAFKTTSGNIFGQFAMNRQWAADSLNHGVNDTVNHVGASGESFWNEDGTGFQHLAAATNGFFTAGVGIATAAAFGFAEHNGAIFSVNSWRKAGEGFGLSIKNGARGMVRKAPSLGKTEVEAMTSGKSVFLKGATSGKFHDIKVPAWKARWGHTAEGISELGGAKSGVWRFAAKTGEESGYFVKKSGITTMKGSIALMAASVVAPMVFSAATNFASQVLDEATVAYNESKRHTYDTREFENRASQTWGFNKQNQYSANMMPYEQNNMSLARIYYNR